MEGRHLEYRGTEGVEAVKVGAGRVIRVEGNVGLQVGWASLHSDEGLPGYGRGKAGSSEAN